MNAEDLREAYLADTELEYHLTGEEKGGGDSVAPGWYQCRIAGFWSNGDTEICFVSGKLNGIYATVLKRNIPIAFRKSRESVEKQT